MARKKKTDETPVEAETPETAKETPEAAPAPEPEPTPEPAPETPKAASAAPAPENTTAPTLPPPPAPARAKRYRCKTKCHWNGRVWEKGDVFTPGPAKVLVPEHFVEA